MKNKILLSTVIISIVVIIIVLLLHFLKPETKETKEFNMVIGYIPHVQFTPFYVGMDKVFFKNHDIDLKISYGFGIDAFSMLINNQIDCTLSDVDQLLLAREKDLPLKTFFQYYQDYPVSIVSLTEKISSIEQLKGKIIGVPQKFGTSYIGLLLFLQYYNISDDVTIEKIGYSQVDSLISNKVDAVVCFYNNEPLMLRKNGYEITEWKVKDYVDMVGAGIISSDKLLEENTDNYLGFILGLKKSIQWTKTHKNEALDIAYKHIKDLKEEDKGYWLSVLDTTLELFYNDDNSGYFDYDKFEKSINNLIELELLDKKIENREVIKTF